MREYSRMRRKSCSCITCDMNRRGDANFPNFQNWRQIYIGAYSLFPGSHCLFFFLNCFCSNIASEFCSIQMGLIGSWTQAYKKLKNVEKLFLTFFKCQLGQYIDDFELAEAVSSRKCDIWAYIVRVKAILVAFSIPVCHFELWKENN